MQIPASSRAICINAKCRFHPNRARAMHIASSCAASCTLHDALQADLHFDIVASSRLGHAERRASTFRPGNDEHLHVTRQPQPEVRLAHAKATHMAGPTRRQRVGAERTLPGWRSPCRKLCLKIISSVSQQPMSADQWPNPIGSHEPMVVGHEASQPRAPPASDETKPHSNECPSFLDSPRTACRWFSAP